MSMDDLISRQAAIDAVSKGCQELRGVFSRCEENILALPSAQPERKMGRWVVVSDGYGNGEATACICECSECKDTIWVYKKANRKWNFCSNCGAEMSE